jgi:hypothetical protein|tara:strand:+ start:161 stop:451 length:291 start_codon:yes stop_codon:yes gene_type:complete
MKIKEQVHHDNKNDKLIVESTYDNNPALERVDQLNRQKVGLTGENRLVGSIPIHIIKMWCDEAGIKWGDNEARREVVRKKILSGDFDKFRVWKGTF